MSTARNFFKKIQKRTVSTLKKHEKNIVFSISLVLASALSFFTGIAYENQSKAGVMVIEKPIVQIAQNSEFLGKVAGTENSKSETRNVEIGTQNTGNCLFVGSKNSDKYHSPSCGYAKNIKSENIVCFQSREEAEGKGYKEGCIK